MKKVCLLVTHEQSGSPALFNILAAHPRIQGYHTGRTYNHPLVLQELTALPHKTQTAAEIWLDELSHNYQFSCKELYRICRFLYMVRPAEATLNALIFSGFEPDFAARYYCYRLRRICEMAKRTPEAVLVTFDDALTGTAFPLIEEYLVLKTPLFGNPASFPTAPVGLAKWDLVKSCQESYERHLFFLRSRLRCNR